MTFRNTRALWYRGENFKDDEGDQTDLTERGAYASHTAAAVDLVRDPLFPPASTRRCRLQVMWARFARVPGRGDCLVSWSGVVRFFFKKKKSACCTRTFHTHVDSSASAFCSREILHHHIFHGGARFLTAGTQGTLMAAMN